MIGSETWTWYIQVEALKKICYFSCCCLDMSLSENSSESPLGDWGQRGGIFTLHTALLERKLRGWRELFSSAPLKHFVLGLSKSDFLLISASASPPSGRQAELWGPPADGSFPQY